jgi:hypothetical protein
VLLRPADLCDDGVDSLAIVGAPPIGGIVAIPICGGIEGIELGKVDRGTALAGRRCIGQPLNRDPLPKGDGVRLGGWES